MVVGKGLSAEIEIYVLPSRTLSFLLQGLNTEDYRYVMRVVEEAILSTDLALYCKKKDLFETIVNEGEIDWQEQDKKQREY